jgi:hypothetical protein
MLTAQDQLRADCQLTLWGAGEVRKVEKRREEERGGWEEVIL